PRASGNHNRLETPTLSRLLPNARFAEHACLGVLVKVVDPLPQIGNFATERWAEGFCLLRVVADGSWPRLPAASNSASLLALAGVQCRRGIHRDMFLASHHTG